MNIALGCDHGGFPLKARLRSVIETAGCGLIDCGTDSDRPVDYPDYALKVAEVLRAGQAERGVLVCGSGVGVAIAANKIPGIRAGVCHDTYSAHQAVEHDDLNVLCLGARVVGEELAAEIVSTFLAARFSHEARHVRRLQKVMDIERASLAGQFPAVS